MKQYKVDFKVRRNRLLLWLMVLLTILLLASIGTFVFLALNARYHFACLFECKQRGNPVPRKQGPSPVEDAVTLDDNNLKATTASWIQKEEESTKIVELRPTSTLETKVGIRNHTYAITSAAAPPTTETGLTDGNNTSAEAKTDFNFGKSSTSLGPTSVADRTTRKPAVNRKGYVSVQGKIFLKGKIPKKFPANSWLIVKFKEDRYMDAPSILLGKTVLELSNHPRSKVISYTVTSKRYEMARSRYSVSAVLNMGWRSKENWIRKGDFFTDRYFNVNVNKLKKIYVRNMFLVKY